MIEIYRVFTLPPDFAVEPESNYISERRDIPLGAANRYGLWDGRGKRVMRATWRTTTLVDTRTVREFLIDNQGRANPFYIPSWTPDLRVVEPAAAGSETLKIVVGTNLQSELDPEKLDEFGTILWLYSRSREMNVVRIISATTNLDGTTDIELEEPISFDVDSSTLGGFCIFARQINDVVECQYFAPDALEVTLQVEEARNTLETTETLPLSGEDVFSYPAITEVVRNPLTELTELRVDYADVKGPEVYGASQTFPHQAEWRIEITETGVRMREAGNPWQDSDLYTAKPEGDHITGAFTVGGREVLSAGLSTGEVEIRYFDGELLPQTVVFDGFAPQAINTWAVDADVSAGDADVVVVYLKKGEAKLYARFSRESYAIEHKLVDSKINPLYLLDIEAEEARLMVSGLDVTHNKTTWESIVTPVPNLLIGNTAFTGEFGGEYESALKIAPTESQDIGTTGEVFGSYESTIQAPPDIEEGGLFSGEVSGEYQETIVKPNTIEEDVGLTGELSAEYTLVVKPTPSLGGEVGTTGEISGSYEIETV